MSAIKSDSDSPVAHPEEGELDNPHYEPSSGGQGAQRASDTKLGPGRPRILDTRDMVRAWEDYVLGANVFELAEKYGTTAAQVGAAIAAMAAELGYPDKHLDPEMERFRISEGSDRMKTAITRCLNDSNKILKEYEAAKLKISAEKNLADLDPVSLQKVLMLNKARSDELKIVIGFLGEYRQINNQLAEICGIRKSKFTRKPKQIASIEQTIEAMSDEDLKRLAAPEGASEANTQ